MKKLLFITLLGLSFACENTEIQKAPKDYSLLIANLDLTHKNAFKAAFNSDPENIPETTLGHLKENYYESDIDLGLGLNYLKQKPSGRVQDEALNLSFLSPQQEAIARPFLENIMSLEELTYTDKIVWLFEKQVTNSTLNEEQKYQLFSMGSLVKQGVQMIRDANAGIGVARSAGRTTKTIDVKAALRNGVQGLALGAASGAYIGATGGTVVVPILGTVVGGVGCAVILGAAGFVSGVAGSILYDLLWD